jgi:hypothetical protein
VGLAVFRVGRDAQGECELDGDGIALEGVLLNAAPDLLGDSRASSLESPGRMVWYSSPARVHGAVLE